MHQEKVDCPQMTLMGLTIRTNNANEMSPNKAKIGELTAQYWGQGKNQQIPNRKQPGRTFSVYTEYEGDEQGDYTYFIGEEITNSDTVPDGFETLTIPAAHYTKFTTEPGGIPEVIIEAWRKIWLMGESEIGGKRAFHADFEIIDTNNLNPEQAVFDIYIGIK